MPKKHLAFSQEDFLELVGLIYDAASDAHSWIPFLKKFSDVLHGVGPNLFVQDLESNSAQFYASDFDPAYQHLYAEHYSKLNEWLIRGKHLMQPGKLRVGQMVISEEELRRTEYYNDWLRPQNFLHGCGATILQAGPLTSIFSMFRPHGSSPFGEPEIAFTERLMPHLKRGLQLQQQFVRMQATAAVSKEILNQMSFGVILVDEKGKTLMINSSAECILDKRDGLMFDKEGIRTTRPRETLILRTMIANAACTGAGNGVHAGGQILISRPSQLRPFSILVSPLRCKGFLMETERAAAVLFIHDPEASIETSEQTLRRLYQLTHCEAMLAMVLLQGKSIGQASSELHVSLNTVRTQLKSIFLKTDTHRQSDLIRLIVTGTSSFRLDPARIP